MFKPFANENGLDLLRKKMSYSRDLIQNQTRYSQLSNLAKILEQTSKIKIKSIQCI